MHSLIIFVFVHPFSLPLHLLYPFACVSLRFSYYYYYFPIFRISDIIIDIDCESSIDVGCVGTGCEGIGCVGSGARGGSRGLHIRLPQCLLVGGGLLTDL